MKTCRLVNHCSTQYLFIRWGHHDRLLKWSKSIPLESYVLEHAMLHRIYFSPSGVLQTTGEICMVEPANLVRKVIKSPQYKESTAGFCLLWLPHGHTLPLDILRKLLRRKTSFLASVQRKASGTRINITTKEILFILRAAAVLKALYVGTEYVKLKLN